MRRTSKILEKLPFLTNGEVLVGLAFVVAGTIVCHSGVVKLLDLWSRLAPYLPLRLPENAGEVILKSLPLIFSSFISTVSALSGSLLGILWIFAGLGDAVTRKKNFPEPAEYQQPEMTAESLRSGEATHWRNFIWIFRVFARRWTRMRYISPVCLEVFRYIMRASLKVVFVGILIFLVFHGLQLVPYLVKRLFQTDIRLVVPSPLSLYGLLALVVFFNILIAVSLVPFRIPQFVRSRQSISIRGRGDPHLFFALLEESCKLLSPKGVRDRQPTRLYHEDNFLIKGTLIESRPEAMFVVSRPAAYFCLPLIVIFLCLGFSRLINFSRPVAEMKHLEFLSSLLPDYCLDVALAVGLILVGVYFSEWARKLFGLRKFRSSMVFCHLKPPQNQDRAKPERTGSSGKTAPSEPIQWHISEGVDGKFAGWAKDPQTAKRFQMEFYWAEASSESMDEISPRFLVGIQRSETLDAMMGRIITLPFHVAFEAGDTAPQSRPVPEPNTQ